MSLKRSVAVDIYTTPGANTWNKRPGAVGVHILMIGGGAGGGSGRKGNVLGSAETAGGGGGGSGGAFGSMYLPASVLGSSEIATVGNGGAGGAAQSTIATLGLPGNNGGDSTFGNWFRILGGCCGQGGQNGSGSIAARATNGFPGSGISNNPNLVFGNVQGPTANGSGSSNPAAATSIAGNAGGAGGSANLNAAGALTVPANGGPVGLVDLKPTGLSANPLAGTSGIGAVLAGGTLDSGSGPGAGNKVATNAPFGGSGGGGALGSLTGNGVKGGNGGLYGGGGGGGGGVPSPFTSGAGGDGAPGIIIVTTFFN